jgi:hypothetical protein
MTAASGWICKVCWKWNRAQDALCYKCKSPHGLTDDAQVAEQRKVLEAKAAQPEVVPDLVVAVPVWVFRGYARVWLRGGMGLLGFLALMAFGGVDDLVWYGLTAGFAVALMVGGFMAGEVAEGMRNREVWAFLTGIGLSVVGVIGAVTAFSIFAPEVNINAVRWGSVLIFGGAGLAAAAGLVLMFRARAAA